MEEGGVPRGLDRVLGGDVVAAVAVWEKLDGEAHWHGGLRMLGDGWVAEEAVARACERVSVIRVYSHVSACSGSGGRGVVMAAGRPLVCASFSCRQALS